MISPTDLFHPPPASHCKAFQVFGRENEIALYVVSPVESKPGKILIYPTRYRSLAIIRKCVVVNGNYRLSYSPCVFHKETGVTTPHIACYMVTYTKLLFTRSKWYQCTLNRGT
jgi:hypothetical protein